jgi:hypothetical protein
MFDMKYAELLNSIKDFLIEKHGDDFLRLSKQRQCNMICDTFIEYMNKQREERQA